MRIIPFGIFLWSCRPYWKICLSPCNQWSLLPSL